jgi:hypothetical protein
MKPNPTIEDLIFGVDQVAIEAVLGSNGSTRRISIGSHPRRLWICARCRQPYLLTFIDNSIHASCHYDSQPL